MERIGHGSRNLILVTVCLSVLVLGNLLIRFSYINTYRSFAAVRGQQRLAQAGALADVLESRARGMEAFLGALAGHEALRGGTMEGRMIVLGRMAPHAAELGGLDLFWVEPDGMSWAAGRTELGLFGASIIAKRTRGEGLSPQVRTGVPFETGEGARGKGIVLMAPVTAGSKAGGGSGVVGHLAALFSLEDLVNGSAGFKMSASRYVAIIGSGKGFVFHPDSDFVGAGISRAMNLARFGRLREVVDKMHGGAEGVDSFDYYDSREGKKVVDWRVAYAPARICGRQWSVGIFEEGAGIGFAGGILRVHLAFGLVFSLMVIAVGAALFRANREIFALGRRLKGLQDATALSGILRSVNQELAEAKQALEIDAEEFDAMTRQVRQAADRLIEACNGLGETIRRPTRPQRECMRDARFEAARLRGEINRLREK
ncbi:MAG: hypothetical protein ABIH66_03500 [bacterium]